MTTADEEFEQLRPVLLGLAYRLLGSMWDAEDVVGDAYLRWARTNRVEVREPRPFLITIVSRLALDQLRSARVTREAYIGPWLPEPVSLDAGPLAAAELRDTLSYATLHLMERLSPPERAVFVLREAFGVPYADIAEIVGAPPASCRQWHHRARTHLATTRERFHPSSEEHARLLTGFVDAAARGDLATLTTMLTEDATAWADGGGRVSAALRPILGRDKVAAFSIGVARRFPAAPHPGAPQNGLVEANGQPALWLTWGDHHQRLTLIDVRGGRIAALYGILNPHKLRHIHLPRSESGDPRTTISESQGLRP